MNLQQDAVHPKYPNVFNPIRLGPVELKNRFYSSPHLVPHSVGGAPNADYIEYVSTRIRGGCGLTVVSFAGFHRTAAPCAYPQPDENLPAFTALADAVHEAGGKIFGQPWYHWGQPGWWSPLSPRVPALSPSVSQYDFLGFRSSTRAMSKAEIKLVIQSLVDSTANLRRAGFDGVMMHASHGTMMEQFLSPYYNRRNDEYGGSFENRLRFVTETLKAVREAAGDEMAVGIRLNCDEMLDGGYGTGDAREYLSRIASSGLIDYVDLDVAVEPDQLWMGMPPVLLEKHPYKPYVEAVRSAAGDIPVMSVMGRLTSIADAEAFLEAGACDMVGAARALIAEPNLVNHAFEGTEERSRTCIACNWCMGGMHEASQSCTVNPTAWHERRLNPNRVEPAPKRCKVIVVGGGPGGMEAARVCALRGHDVQLFEAHDTLGGALALWAGLPGREFFAKSIEWWVRELERLNVTVNLGTKAISSAILAEDPDAVILATGALHSAEGRSNFRDFPVPGHDRDFVCLPEQVLRGDVSPSGRVVILDGEGTHAGVGVAEVLGKRGCEVEFVTPSFTPVSTRVQTAEETRFIMQRLHEAGVTISPRTYASEIGNHEVSCFDVYSGEERTIPDVDCVVLSTGRVSVNQLEHELDGKIGQLYVIGDAASARMWGASTFEGHFFARFIGEPGVPANISEGYFGSRDLSSCLGSEGLCDAQTR